jgi:hypothetical protein
MKLISTYKDYYDYLARDRAMSDQTHTWERKPKVVDVNFAIPAPVRITESGRRFGRNSDIGVEAFGFIIWFCGKVIPVVRVTRPALAKDSDSYVFSFDELPPEIIKDNEKTRKWKTFLRKVDFSLKGRMLTLFDLADKPWDAVEFSAIPLPGHAIAQKIPIDDMHRRLNSPIFCHADGVPEMMGDESNYGRSDHRYSSTVIVNPLLSAAMIHKVIDAFSAFQSIERYLTNELAPRDVKRDASIKEHSVPDKIKAESHGFDRWSFRKEPTKKKSAKR